MYSGVCLASVEVGTALQPQRRSRQGHAQKQEEIGSSRPTRPAEATQKFVACIHLHAVWAVDWGKYSPCCPLRIDALPLELDEKHFIAKCSTVKHFVHAHLLLYRMGTHKCQREPEEVAAEASNYMHLMCPLLDGPHRDRHFILNMVLSKEHSWRTKKLRVVLPL